MWYNIENKGGDYLKWHYTDGGRKQYYKAKNVRDCVTRAIAIANNMDYKIVYKELFKRCKESSYNESPRQGVYEQTYSPYLEELGWHEIKCEKNNIHMRKNELPTGTIICKTQKHLATVIDGVLYDTWESSKNETAKVIKYWTKENY